MTAQATDSKSDMKSATPSDVAYYCEYWSGDSRDGKLVNGDGAHYFKMTPEGVIVEAVEYYETDEGDEVVTQLPDLKGLSWFKDFGYEDFDALVAIKPADFARIAEQAKR